jgi:hypothetical protein
MKIKKKGKKFVAYYEEGDNFPNTKYNVGSEIGEISITTGRFTGGTSALVELKKHLDEYLKPERDKHDKLINDVIAEIKIDIENGDLTAIDELLRFVSKEYLEGYLPEN